MPRSLNIPRGRDNPAKAALSWGPPPEDDVGRLRAVLESRRRQLAVRRQNAMRYLGQKKPH